MERNGLKSLRKEDLGLNFSLLQDHLESSIKHRSLGPTPGFLIQEVWVEGAGESVFPSSSQVIRRQLV